MITLYCTVQHTGICGNHLLSSINEAHGIQRDFTNQSVVRYHHCNGTEQHLHTDIQRHIHTMTHTHTQTDTQTYRDTYTQWHTHTHTQTYRDTYTQWHTHTHTFTQTYRDTYTQWHTHTHTISILTVGRGSGSCSLSNCPTGDAVKTLTRIQRETQMCSVGWRNVVFTNYHMPVNRMIIFWPNFLNLQLPRSTRQDGSKTSRNNFNYQ